MTRPFTFSVNTQNGESFQLAIAHDALCGAFVRKTGWLDAFGSGLGGAQGEFGLVLFVLLLPVLIIGSWLAMRHEKAITTLLQYPDFESRDERDFRLPREHIEEFAFSLPLRGDRFMGNWQLEARLRNGEVRAWTLNHRGTPRAQAKALCALGIPVHPG